jgi:hypothetical protein
MGYVDITGRPLCNLTALQDGKDDPDDRPNGVQLYEAQSGCGVRFHFHDLFSLLFFFF